MKTKPIYTYTSQQAVEDGALFDLLEVDKDWEQGLFRYVTGSLMNLGYCDNIANLIDLLNQSQNIIKEKSKNFKEFDTFFDGEIELPSGETQKIFIAQNELGKFTIMLPGDY